jgi:signal recognition particle receptor subunit beta
MKPSHLAFSSSQKSIPIVDFPGHPRLRTQLMESLSSAKKIVFVIDASNIQSHVRVAAEFLYDLFTNPLMDNGPSVMVACNKSDVAGARPPARVKLALQQEIEKIRKTRQTLEVTGESDVMPLGREGKEFVIERDSPVEVLFSAISGKSGSLDAITDFISL